MFYLDKLFPFVLILMVGAVAFALFAAVSAGLQEQRRMEETYYAHVEACMQRGHSKMYCQQISYRVVYRPTDLVVDGNYSIVSVTDL